MESVERSAELPSVSERVGEHRLLRMLGAGASGAVFEAERAGRRAAVKVLLPELLDDPRSVARFVVEARAVSSIAHPNVIRVEELVETTAPRRLAVVMELLAGPSLKQALRDESIDAAAAIAIARQIADALVVVHEAGIVHRDLKPANLVFARPLGVGPPEVKLVDFGLAKVKDAGLVKTKTGATVGTPAYMAPEQVVRREEPTGAADVFAWAVIVHEMLTRARLFEGPLKAMLKAKLRGELPPVDLPAETPNRTALLGLLRRCLARRPEERPSARDVRAFFDGLEWPNPVEASTLREGDPLLEDDAAVSGGGASSGATSVQTLVTPARPAPLRSLTSGPAPHRGRLGLVAGIAVLAVVVGVGILASRREAEVVPVAPLAPVASPPAPSPARAVSREPEPAAPRPIEAAPSAPVEAAPRPTHQAERRPAERRPAERPAATPPRARPKVVPVDEVGSW